MKRKSFNEHKEQRIKEPEPNSGTLPHEVAPAETNMKVLSSTKHYRMSMKYLAGKASKPAMASLLRY